MTPEKTIEWLKSQNILDKEYTLDAEAIEDACDALEKQIPLKVGFDKRTGDYVCPDCGHDVVGSCLFCWACGRKLKWEDN